MGRDRTDPFKRHPPNEMVRLGPSHPLEAIRRSPGQMSQPPIMLPHRRAGQEEQIDVRICNLSSTEDAFAVDALVGSRRGRNIVKRPKNVWIVGWLLLPREEVGRLRDKGGTGRSVVARGVR